MVASGAGGSVITTAAGSARSYDRYTILFHWVVVALVAAQWLGAHAIDWFPRGALRTDARSLHILFGSALAAIILARLAWRWTGGRKLPPADHGGLRVLAVTVQGLLYVLLVATVSLGLANAWVRGDSLFGLFSIPKLPVGQDVKHQIGEVHGLAANLILALAAVHSGAALLHQFVWKDGLLGRMVPSMSRRG